MAKVTGGGFPVDRGAGAEVQNGAKGWTEAAKATFKEAKEDNAPLLAAGVAFYGLLALVPALVAMVSIYGLFANPEDVERTVNDSLAAAPVEVQDLVSQQLDSIVTGASSALTVGAIIGVAAALWSVSAGMKHLITAINEVYGEHEDRGGVKLRGLALAMTAAVVVLGGIALYVLVVLPRSLDTSGAEGGVLTTLEWARWPLLAVGVMVMLTVLYRLAPDRPSERSRWKWLSPGAVLATVLFVVASVAFSIYTSNFGRYNETYGVLGTIVVVMLWLYIGAYAVVFGAELNVVLEERGRRRGAGTAS
jgi:membrane protein